MNIEFDETERELFEEIITLYYHSKNLMIYAEEISGERFLPAIEEFRHAFDHLMRVFEFKLGFKQVDADYAMVNLEQAFNHLYRANYGLLDFLSLLFREKVQDEIKRFSEKTLEWIFPKYYHEIKPYFEIILPKELSKLRNEKGKGNPIEKYIEIINKLKSYYEEILENKPNLVKYEKETRHERIVWQIIIGILATVIGTIILKIIGLL